MRKALISLLGNQRDWVPPYSALLHCINASNTGNKQEELEVRVQLPCDNLMGITGLWWDSSHHCCTAMDGCWLSSKDRLGGQGEGAVVCVEQRDHLQLLLGLDHQPTGSLWVRITRQTNTGYIVVGVCYRFPDHEEVGKNFFRELE